MRPASRHRFVIHELMHRLKWPHTKGVFLRPFKRCEKISVPRPIYMARASIKLVAWRLSGSDCVVTVKVWASSSAEV